MNTISKILLSCLLGFATLTAMAQPQDGQQPDAVTGATPAEQHHGQPAPDGQPHQGCMMHGGMPSVDFQSVKICFAPQMGAFIAIDSVECSVHLVSMTDEGLLDTMASYKTDVTRKRHDLKNILRPVSVGIMGPYFVVLASAVNDSAYVALLDEHLNEVARRSFSSPMYAMHFEFGHMFIVGRNPYGYDINILKLHGGPDALAKGDPKAFENGEILTHHYRVAKQAEKIKHSDPVGLGLTATAVSVVFLALVCIALLISGSGRLIQNTEEKQKNKGKKAPAIKPVSDGSSANDDQEVYAALAAAIHLYNEELHDEEDTVITIQKVEREWTPWNAKYYNMNHYFNNRR